MVLLQGKVSPDATEDAAEGGMRASMLLAGLLKVMCGYQRCIPDSLAEVKVDAAKLLPKVGQAAMQECADVSAFTSKSFALSQYPSLILNSQFCVGFQ